MFKIQTTYELTKSFERIMICAVDKQDNSIFGATAEVYRHKSITDSIWGEWVINYGTSGAKTYQEALPYIQVINKALEILKLKLTGEEQYNEKK